MLLSEPNSMRSVLQGQLRVRETQMRSSTIVNDRTSPYLLLKKLARRYRLWSVGFYLLRRARGRYALSGGFEPTKE